MSDATVHLTVRLPEPLRDAFHAAAERSGMQLSEWARVVLAHAAGCSELAEQLGRVEPLPPRGKRPKAL